MHSIGVFDSRKGKLVTCNFEEAARRVYVTSKTIQNWFKKAKKENNMVKKYTIFTVFFDYENIKSRHKGNPSFLVNK